MSAYCVAGTAGELADLWSGIISASALEDTRIEVMRSLCLPTSRIPALKSYFTGHSVGFFPPNAQVSYIAVCCNIVIPIRALWCFPLPMRRFPV
jgi:hypothetical protein